MSDNDRLAAEVDVKRDVVRDPGCPVHGAKPICVNGSFEATQRYYEALKGKPCTCGSVPAAEVKREPSPKLKWVDAFGVSVASLFGGAVRLTVRPIDGEWIWVAGKPLRIAEDYAPTREAAKLAAEQAVRDYCQAILNELEGA